MRLEELIYTYSSAMKQRYGKKVFRVGLSTGIVCPHRKNGGCIFCNPDSFRGKYQVNLKSIAKQLEKGKAIIRKHCSAEKFVAYFQDETSTAGDIQILMDYFQEAAGDSDILELIVSTRPDFINEEILDNLKKIEKPVTVEIGVQSIHNKSLKFLNRGHTFEQTQEAIGIIADSGLNAGVHLIIGIPGESIEEMKETILWVASQKVISEVKFHNLIIYKGTKLEEMWKAGIVKQMPISQYIEILSELLPYLRKDIVISRLFTSNILHNDLTVVPLKGNKTKWMNELRLKLEKRVNEGTKARRNEGTKERLLEN